MLPPGNWGDKDTVAKVLEKMRKKLCMYRSQSRCDCKYTKETNRTTGEETGCPELRCAIALLEAMTDAEYEKISFRSMKNHGMNVKSLSLIERLLP